MYLGQQGQTLVVLLCGGDKRTQERDIRLAKQYWHQFKEKKSLTSHRKKTTATSAW